MTGTLAVPFLPHLEQIHIGGKRPDHIVFDFLSGDRPVPTCTMDSEYADVWAHTDQPALLRRHQGRIKCIDMDDPSSTSPLPTA